jgi:malate dehydrogenase (oxaloacetate-decarboxylating)
MENIPSASYSVTLRVEFPHRAGALDVRAREINEEMKLAAAEAMAGVISDEELSEDYIIPSVFDKRVAPAVAEAVAETAKEPGVARRVQERSETGLSTTKF